MKKSKTLLTMLAAVAALFLLPNAFTLKASAAQRTTYYIEYSPEYEYDSEKGENIPLESDWYVLISEDESHKSLDFFYNNVKCGDEVVVSCTGDNAPLLDLGSTRLGNVTILPGSSFVMIKSAGIADFFALSGTTSSISAPVIHAYIYDTSTVNFNYNVKDILLNVDGWISDSAIACLGTVESLKLVFPDNSYNTMYDFSKDTLYFRYGGLLTDPSNYHEYPPSNSPFYIYADAVTAATLKDVFDEKYYADTYPDLKAAFGYNREALWTHYISNGIYEGRRMNGFLNITLYRYQNADLNAAFGNNWDLYLWHYLNYGIKEGRNSWSDFNAAEYTDWYDELKVTYGNNLLALIEHYQKVGIEWSRKP